MLLEVRIALAVLAGTLGLMGCALERSPLVAESAVDAGLEVRIDAPLADLDAAPPDVGVVPLDAGPPDTGPECSGTVARCDVETFVTCVAGRFVSDDCAGRGGYCDAAGCVAQVCVPDSVTCAGPIETRCDTRGASSSSATCPRGCMAALGCSPPTACARSVAGSIGIGTMRVDTCGQGNDSVHNTGCTRTDRTGSDLVVRLEVPARADYRIELLVVGGADAVLYIRRECADASTELSCDDDTASGFGSQIDITLDPGDYFLMLDSFRDTEGPDGRCGEMDLVVALR